MTKHVMAKFNHLETNETTIDLLIRYDMATGAYELIPYRNGQIVEEMPANQIIMALEHIKLGSLLQSEGL